MFSGNNKTDTTAKPVSEQIKDKNQRASEVTREGAESVKATAQNTTDQTSSGISSITEKMKQYMGLGQEKAQETKDQLASRGEEERQKVINRANVVSDETANAGAKNENISSRDIAGTCTSPASPQVNTNENDAYGNNTLGSTSESALEEARRAREALPRTEGALSNTGQGKIVIGTTSESLPDEAEYTIDSKIKSEPTISDKVLETTANAREQISEGAEQAREGAMQTKDHAASGAATALEKAKEYTGLKSGPNTAQGSDTGDESVREQAARMKESAAANSSQAKENADKQASEARERALAGAEEVKGSAQAAFGAVGSGATSITEKVKQYMGFGGETVAGASEATSQYVNEAYDSTAAKARGVTEQVGTKAAETRDSIASNVENARQSAVTQASQTHDALVNTAEDAKRTASAKVAETHDTGAGSVEEGKNRDSEITGKQSAAPTMTEKVKQFMGYDDSSSNKPAEQYMSEMKEKAAKKAEDAEEAVHQKSNPLPAGVSDNAQKVGYKLQNPEDATLNTPKDISSNEPSMAEKVKSYISPNQSSEPDSKINQPDSLGAGHESVSLAGTGAGVDVRTAGEQMSSSVNHNATPSTAKSLQVKGEAAGTGGNDMKDKTYETTQSAAQRAQEYLEQGKQKLFENMNIARDKALDAKDAVAQKTSEDAQAVKESADDVQGRSKYRSDSTSGLQQIQDEAKYANAPTTVPNAKTVADRIQEYGDEVNKNKYNI